MPTQLQGYGKMWDEAVYDKQLLDHAIMRMRMAFQSVSDYITVSNATKVPYQFIMPIHERESAQNFKTHLHNGDPLSARTTHVPAGRPTNSNPPFKWTTSAIDALQLEGLDKVTNWSVERILYEFHKYNGITKRPSGYLLSGTQYYTSGMYVSDHNYDPNAKDKRPGCMAMLKAICLIDPRFATNLNQKREPLPPKDVINETKKKATRTATSVAIGTGSIATTGAASQLHPKTTIPSSAVPIGIGVCAAIFTAAIIFVVIKGKRAHDDLHLQWTGSER